MAPSTFASAAAGSHNSQISSRDAASDWSRRTNGATQTFRRASGATTTPAASHNDVAASQSARYVPPHRNGTLSDMRYAKDQLYDLYRSQQNNLKDGLPNLYVGGWQPETTNGSTSAWGRNDTHRDTQTGLDVCWDSDARGEPLGLIEMDDEERELFTTSVNTPMKPQIITGKDGSNVNGSQGRKASISGGGTTPGAYGIPSPSVARVGNRRRETSESYPFPQNSGSGAGGFGRDDQRAASPPPSLLRRRTDVKSDDRDKDADEKPNTPFGTLKRHPTGPMGSGFGAPTSPWSATPQSAGLSPMGTFGNFGLGGATGQPGVPGDKQRPGLGSGRTESRFKSLLSKDSQEDSVSRTSERKASISSLTKVNENESWRGQDASEQDDLEAEDALPTGSASLVADTDVSPPHARRNNTGFGTPSRQGVQGDFGGIGAFGMTSNSSNAFGQGFGLGREAFSQTPAHQRVPRLGGGNEPMSPTDTNPYQSPEPNSLERGNAERATDDNDAQSTHLPGLGGFGSESSGQLGGLGGLSAIPHHTGRPLPPASDRSQTSSVGPGRGFHGLSGLGSLGGGSGGWPVGQGGLGTPGGPAGGLSHGFGSGIFNQMSDLHNPSGLAGLGGPHAFGGSNGPFGGSRLASVFPDHARQNELRPEDSHERLATQPFLGLGEIGRPGESAFNNQQFGDGQQDHGDDHHGGQFGAPGQQAGQMDHSPAPSNAQTQILGGSTSTQPPAPQQRTMVMPDRMRWIYRDPQGQTQGPWSGLEMHDWYKAGFFSPELLVKKYEDQDYEPLAQLIRRIGNSREPFLVPQIGIPHGAPTGSGPNAWAGSSALGGSGSATVGGAQPPFASSFPSFGTTLTADQQNALERRKQEEQYLMARQKEHLAQAQMSQRYQLQGVGHPGLIAGQLHHHSSAHSLHSQPSFGSITSPAGGYQASPLQGPLATGGIPHQSGFFDNSFRGPQMAGIAPIGSGMDSLSQIREEDMSGIMDRLNLGGQRTGPGQFGAPGQPTNAAQQADNHEKQVQQMLQDRAHLAQEQAEHDAAQQEFEDESDDNERLREFEQFQEQELGSTEKAPALINTQIQPSESQSSVDSPDEAPAVFTSSLKKAAATKQSEPGLPQPFPAPNVSKTTLAAPEPQRPGRSIVAEHLQKEDRDRSETPSVESKIAPWAKQEAVEVPKGPSLREIQEMEARQAAKAEELALAARRAALQKAMEAEAQAAVVLPGLPAASNWATAGSPATPTSSVPAAWAKTAQKPTGPATAKSMAQIQKEEEARKRKLAAATAAAQASVPAPVAVTAGGKSYANLAGKIITPATAGVGGAWTTVGAGGKTKTPVSATPPAATRTVSASVLPAVQAAAAVRRVPSRSSTMMSAGTINAQEEFKKWAANELRPDLSKGISAEDFVSNLTMLPAESDIITEAVHGVSSTIDSRHFAEEFLRRKKLADKGMVDSAPLKTASPHHASDGKAGGWNEVAKKGPSKDASAVASKDEASAGNGLFRVVAAKKKGGKR